VKIIIETYVVLRYYCTLFSEHFKIQFLIQIFFYSLLTFLFKSNKQLTRLFHQSIAQLMATGTALRLAY